MTNANRSPRRFRGVSGEVQGLVGISHDITDQKLKESRLASLTEQLRAQNEQMETDLQMAREIQQAFSRGQGGMRALMADLGLLYKNVLYLHSFFEFLQLQPRVVDPAEPVPVPARMVTGIELKNVTFRYPGSNRSVLA